MNKLAIPFSIAALMLAACAEPYIQPAPLPASSAPIVPQPLAYATGYGTVETVRSSGRDVRLGIRMQEGGTMQYVDTDTDQFPKGTKVLLTSDHMLKKM
jgi:hypothetical protein